LHHKNQANSKQSPLHPKMIAKEIAAKVAQFEYELDFEVCKHTPQTWCKQASKLCRFVPASKLHRIVLASKQAPQICANKLHR
jgi:hypothetical protein